MAEARPFRIDVTSERGPYPVLVAPGLTGDPEALFASLNLAGPFLLVSAPNIWKAHGDQWRALAGPKGPVLVSDGETFKTLATVGRLYDAFSANGVDRAWTVVALGGGVLGDLAGFAAATYLRGIKVVQVPTTLLAQVDSAIGGKTGANLPSGKNLVGAFHSPSAVVCDPDLLGTLPRREFRAGLYEVIKYGVIAAPPILDTMHRSLDAIFNRAPDVLTPLIADCCRIKATVVMADERESGPRRALNFGHTVGHALEAITDYGRFRHGEAVGYGMLAAAHVSTARGLLSSTDADAITAVIRSLGPMPGVSDLPVTDALTALMRDKKVIGGTLHFVAARGLGATAMLSDVTAGELTDALAAIGLKA